MDAPRSPKSETVSVGRFGLFQLHPSAIEEIAEAAHWYEDQVNGLGERFLAALESTLELAEDRPSIGAVWTSTVLPGNIPARRLRVPGFPYQVIYLVEGEHIVILAVSHFRRMPGYWAPRLPL
jgi:toxin ParE1/3/4